MTEEEKGMGWRHAHPALRGLRVLGMVLAGITFAGLFALAFGWLVMVLWNWIMPAIFGLGEISYWQGFGILLLAKIVFGAFGARGPRGHPWRANPWFGSPFRKESWHRGDWPGDRQWWRYYHDYWRDEGREAFERYRERKKAEEASGQGPQKA